MIKKKHHTPNALIQHFPDTLPNVQTYQYTSLPTGTPKHPKITYPRLQSGAMETLANPGLQPIKSLSRRSLKQFTQKKSTIICKPELIE